MVCCGWGSRGSAVSCNDSYWGGCETWKWQRLPRAKTASRKIGDCLHSNGTPASSVSIPLTVTLVLVTVRTIAGPPLHHHHHHQHPSYSYSLLSLSNPQLHLEQPTYAFPMLGSASQHVASCAPFKRINKCHSDTKHTHVHTEWTRIRM